MAAIGRHPEDLPFAAICLDRPDGPYVAAAGIDVSRVRDAREIWSPARTQEGPEVVRGIGARTGPVIHALSGRPVDDAVVMDLGAHGTLVVGLSPSRRIDDGLMRFVRLLRTQIMGLLSQADAIQTEQARVEELRALDRAKTNFLENVSHELRTPVTLMLAPLADALADKSGRSTRRSGPGLTSRIATPAALSGLSTTCWSSLATRRAPDTEGPRFPRLERGPRSWRARSPRLRSAAASSSSWSAPTHPGRCGSTRVSGSGPS